MDYNIIKYFCDSINASCHDCMFYKKEENLWLCKDNIGFKPNSPLYNSKKFKIKNK